MKKPLRRCTLRQCLITLGFTDSEMRFRPSSTILVNWVNEIDELASAVKAKWRQRIQEHHEARGGNEFSWSAVNTAYSLALQKIYDKRPNEYVRNSSKRKPVQVAYGRVWRKRRRLFETKDQASKRRELAKARSKAYRARQKRKRYLESITA